MLIGGATDAYRLFSYTYYGEVTLVFCHAFYSAYMLSSSSFHSQPVVCGMPLRHMVIDCFATPLPFMPQVAFNTSTPFGFRCRLLSSSGPSFIILNFAFVLRQILASRYKWWATEVPPSNII